jgi:hypothetical protein
MIGGVISVLVCIWFYRTALRLNLNVLQWIVGALGAALFRNLVMLKQAR